MIIDATLTSGKIWKQQLLSINWTGRCFLFQLQNIPFRSFLVHKFLKNILQRDRVPCSRRLHYFPATWSWPRIIPKRHVTKQSNNMHPNAIENLKMYLISKSAEHLSTFSFSYCQDCSEKKTNIWLELSTSKESNSKHK